ncbi:MAG: hypothetical protein JWN23_2072 [Rhodocyclales bacterium]|nr:hypothetical protein [Rhodocyclales bacterium]
MSLLIDALKQAEAARAQAKGESQETPEGLQLEPLPSRSHASPAAPASNVRDESRSTSSRETRRPRSTTQASGIVASDAARELFEVKRQETNHMPLILAGVGVLLLLAGAGYVWWAIQPHSNLTGPALNADVPAAQAMTSLPIPAVSGTSSSAASLSPALQTDAAATPPDATPRRHERHGMFRADSTKGAAEAAPIDDTKPQIRSGTPGSSDANGIQAAYAAFLDGNYSLAQQRYQEVLRQDPRSVDAMNALGLIAWRSTQPDVAERMFRAALHADPKDVTAMAQLTLLYSEGDPAAAEGRLRNLIASQPSAAAAHYALGSLLSRQGRWNEAQQALFQAYTLDSDNPDVLFNLAVSLEHLAQPATARQFYERALQAAARRPAGFDKSVALGRVQALASR